MACTRFVGLLIVYGVLIYSYFSTFCQDMDKCASVGLKLSFRKITSIKNMGGPDVVGSDSESETVRTTS